MQLLIFPMPVHPGSINSPPITAGLAVMVSGRLAPPPAPLYSDRYVLLETDVNLTKLALSNVNPSSIPAALIRRHAEATPDEPSSGGEEVIGEARQAKEALDQTRSEEIGIDPGTA